MLFLRSSSNGVDPRFTFNVNYALNALISPERVHSFFQFQTDDLSDKRGLKMVEVQSDLPRLIESTFAAVVAGGLFKHQRLSKAPQV